MAAIRDTFFQECEEQLGELESGLLVMQSGTADGETVNAVFRAVHSMKGGAGIFALDALVQFAHVFETNLDKIRSNQMQATPLVMNLLLRAADALADLVRAARDGGDVDQARIRGLAGEFSQLDALAAGGAMPQAVQEPQVQLPSPRWNIYFRPEPPLYAKANEAALLLRELGRLGPLSAVLQDSELPALADIDPDGAYLAWRLSLHASCTEAQIRDVFEFVEGDCVLEISQVAPAAVPSVKIDLFAPLPNAGFEIFEPLGPPDTQEPAKFEIFAPATDSATEAKFEIFAMPGPDDALPVAQEQPDNIAVTPRAGIAAATAPAEPAVAKSDSAVAANTTIRVDLDRVDRLIDLVGELAINEAMLNQRVLQAGIARSSAVAMALEELEHLTREIQDSVMAIRAQPVRSVFQRMPRLVREVAAQTGKQVRLLTEGEGTEVDKTVIERIADPLTHMIRNAIDHGLESPADRRDAGKPEEGVVRLTALHRSGRIVLEVADDGAGINRARVKAKAAESGLIAADAPLSDDEIDNLIFLPGFSTASKISNISGRGVGMDVVRKSVQTLGGRISISSRPGLGSTFTLSLPLTLAVLDGMVVSAASHTLIIPLGAIIETLKPRACDVHPLDNDIRVLALRGDYVAVVDLGVALGYRATRLEPSEAVALLVESESGSRAVLLVDEIHGQRQVVIKSLETNYRAVPGIAAATVMGDGRVALILDVDAVVIAAKRDSAKSDFSFPEMNILKAS